ncbi:MAG: gliding motility protein GldB [Dysgonamonadaceae bacterium]|jgi:hypothetical protein|nr:gliding motility protein GldB [Dysgonamonadaceae bacterium]
MKRNRSRKSPIILFTVISFLFSGCSGKTVYGEEYSRWQIHRFDTDLYAYLCRGETSIFNETNRLFLDGFGKHVIDIGTSDSVGFEERLIDYFSEPTLRNLYADEQKKLEDISHINKELAYGMEMLLTNFPSLKPPRIYIHVSGLNQNVVVTDDVLSLSADKYMGSDYPLYQGFFYDYQRQLMAPERIAPDYLLGFLTANFPLKGNNEILLNKILYEGKLRYLLSRLLPDRKVWEYVGYNEEQYRWCVDREAKIWTLILENKHLFTSDYRITEKYIKPAPYTAFLPVESPGRVGVWLGFRIIGSYMENNPQTSLSDLIAITDYNELLQKSKYRPFKN